LRIANDSEIENVEARIARAKNNRSKLTELRRELERLEAVRDEMGLFDAPPGVSGDDDTDAEDGNASAPPANLTGVPCEDSTPPPSISYDYRGVPQGMSPTATIPSRTKPSPLL
jgi:hypothetical protein